MSCGAACAGTWGRAAHFVERLLKALGVSMLQSILRAGEVVP
jgi:hypothetical protein